MAEGDPSTPTGRALLNTDTCRPFPELCSRGGPGNHEPFAASSRRDGPISSPDPPLHPPTPPPPESLLSKGETSLTPTPPTLVAEPRNDAISIDIIERTTRYR